MDGNNRTCCFYNQVIIYVLVSIIFFESAVRKNIFAKYFLIKKPP